MPFGGYGSSEACLLVGTGGHGKIGARQTPWDRLGAVNFNPFIKISPTIAFYLFTICYRISRNFPAIHDNEHPWKYERTTWLPMRFDSRLKLQKRHLLPAAPQLHIYGCNALSCSLATGTIGYSAFRWRLFVSLMVLAFDGYTVEVF